MDDKEFVALLNKSRSELYDLLQVIKTEDPNNKVVLFLIETIEQLIDLGEQNYCHLRERLMEFNQ